MMYFKVASGNVRLYILKLSMLGFVKIRYKHKSWQMKLLKLHDVTSERVHSLSMQIATSKFVLSLSSFWNVNFFFNLEMKSRQSLSEFDSTLLWMPKFYCVIQSIKQPHTWTQICLPAVFCFQIHWNFFLINFWLVEIFTRRREKN